MRTIHKCQCHGNDYTVCGVCDHQYCPIYWRACPRCVGYKVAARRQQGPLSLHEAIVLGLAKAEAAGLTKPADVAFAVEVALDEAGLKVIRTKPIDPTTAFTKSR